MLAWNQLVELPAPELAKRDVAETHLACAVGLPGAECLDVPLCLKWVDSIAGLVEQMTDKQMPVFEKNPSAFENSEARFRMCCLVTALRRDLGVYGDDKLNHNPNCSNWEDLFIHGVMRGKGGNCSTLPVLYVAVGRRLGYQLKFARTACHLFARWEQSGSERFNIECMCPGFDTPSDEYYLSWPRFLRPGEFEAGLFLKTKTPHEELAGFLIQRAFCLAYNKQFKDAVDACVGACIAAPANKMHEDSTVKMIRAWKRDLSKSLPPLFPKLLIHPSATRRYPLRIPYNIEREAIRLEVLEQLLDDPGNERRWWRDLRKRPAQRPRHVPCQIEISKTERSLFPSERNIL